MDEKNFEKEVKEALKNKTNHYLDGKDEVWRNIESRLNLKEKSPKRQKTTKSKGRFVGIAITAAVLVVLLGFATVTTTGQAFVERLKQYFEPEKNVVTEIEGHPEEQEVILHERADYVIYIDEERYKMIHEGDKDIVTTKEPLEERYPEVSMTISQVIDKTPEQLAKEYSEELKTSFATVKEIETVTEPVNGILVSAIDGSEWDSPVNKIYLVSNGNEGSFVFDLKYFLEAAEGHGARFYHMLEEFQIVQK
ncbi:hypothetical protein QMK38_09890 [Lysinibacillus fusiformis]|nr:hypothetical protein [Lysinibacillus fusiformis]